MITVVRKREIDSLEDAAQCLALEQLLFGNTILIRNVYICCDRLLVYHKKVLLEISPELFQRIARILGERPEKPSLAIVMYKP